MLYLLPAAPVDITDIISWVAHWIFYFWDYEFTFMGYTMKIETFTLSCILFAVVFKFLKWFSASDLVDMLFHITH